MLAINPISAITADELEKFETIKTISDYFSNSKMQRRIVINENLLHTTRVNFATVNFFFYALKKANMCTNIRGKRTTN